MANGKGRGLLLAGLAVGAYAYFKNPENREKATLAFNNAKEKVNSYMESQNLDDIKKPAQSEKDTQKLRENKMVSEGSPDSVQYFNEEGQQNVENKKLSANDTSKEKSENTDTVSPEPRISTDNI
ncbi:hypothetical protein [Planococcus sp. CAU13]|uniref:hypothetical protein n=1 Tax=Planococcus sp. CAU13 TaxID=1541197 RepID=UPI0005300516|nr:hypothetical protein [Planococcus sp. CAU13]